MKSEVILSNRYIAICLFYDNGFYVEYYHSICSNLCFNISIPLLATSCITSTL